MLRTLWVPIGDLLQNGHAVGPLSFLERGGRRRSLTRRYRTIIATTCRLHNVLLPSPTRSIADEAEVTMSASDRRSFLKTMRTVSRWMIRISLSAGLVFSVILAGAAQEKPHASKPDSDDDAAENRRELLPTGQFITPLAPPGAVQQFLNPGLAKYPDFVANEAVRSQLSPDGNTLLVLCAGYNTNIGLAANGLSAFVDVPASSQYIFVFDVTGSHRSKPALR